MPAKAVMLASGTSPADESIWICVAAIMKGYRTMTTWSLFGRRLLSSSPQTHVLSQVGLSSGNQILIMLSSTSVIFIATSSFRFTSRKSSG